MRSMPWFVLLAAAATCVGLAPAKAVDPCPISLIWEDEFSDPATYHYEVSDCNEPEETYYLISLIKQTTGECGPMCSVQFEDQRKVFESAPFIRERENGERLPVKFTVPDYEGEFLFAIAWMPNHHESVGVAIKEEGQFPKYANGGNAIPSQKVGQAAEKPKMKIARKPMEPHVDLTPVKLQVLPNQGLDPRLLPTRFVILDETVLNMSGSKK